MIWPLSVVSQEKLNPRAERRWAVEQLRRIAAVLGIRQAALLANTIAKDLVREAASVVRSSPVPDIIATGVVEQPIAEFMGEVVRRDELFGIQVGPSL